MRIEAGGVDVHALAGREQIGECQADDQRDGGHDLEIQQRLAADAADFLQIAGAGDAVHHDAEHDRRHDHRDQLQEGVAEEFKPMAKPGAAMPSTMPSTRPKTT